MVKYDSSCGKNFVWKTQKDPGWEIVSFKASTLDDLEEICNVAEQIKEDGSLPNNNCGFHIHADVSDFTIKDIGVFFSRWIKIEEKLCSALPIRRLKNPFCKLISKSKKFLKSNSYTPEDIWSKIKPTNLSPHENPQKKYAINSVSLAASLKSGLSVSELQQSPSQRCTLELRLPEGTLEKEDIKNWVLLFLSILDSAKNSEVSPNLLAVRYKKDFFNYCGISENLELRNWFEKRVSLFKKEHEDYKKEQKVKKLAKSTDKKNNLKDKFDNSLTLTEHQKMVKKILQDKNKNLSVKKNVKKPKKVLSEEVQKSLNYIEACFDMWNIDNVCISIHNSINND